MSYTGENFKIENGDVAPYKLTDAELERLAILAEECAEVQQVIGKIIRHGYQSYSPFDELKTTNRCLLEGELGDLAYAATLMGEVGDIDRDNIIFHTEQKKKRIKQYLHHN